MFLVLKHIVILLISSHNSLWIYTTTGAASPNHHNQIYTPSVSRSPTTVALANQARRLSLISLYLLGVVFTAVFCNGDDGLYGLVAVKQEHQLDNKALLYFSYNWGYNLGHFGNEIVSSSAAEVIRCKFSREDWILLSVGQDEFHNEAVDTLNYVVNQSDYTVQTLEDESLTGSTSTYAKEHVAEIRRTKFSIGEEPNPLTEDLHQLDAPRESSIRKVYLVGRRGPVQAACTAIELREILTIKDLHININEIDLLKTSADEEEMKNNCIRRRVFELLSKASSSASPHPSLGQRELYFTFFRKPEKFLKSSDKSGYVYGVNFETTTLKGSAGAGNQIVVGTGQHEDLNCGLVLKSIDAANFALDNVVSQNSNRRADLKNIDGPIGDPQVTVNKLSSIKTQLPHEYYYLNYCKPKYVTNCAENLGEVLRDHVKIVVNHESDELLSPGVRRGHSPDESMKRHLEQAYLAAILLDIKAWKIRDGSSRITTVDVAVLTSSATLTSLSSLNHEQY
ncbi:NADPH:adrenodoxin oxidoreductase, mitochondrial isoform X2 [Tanacetum coccineum]